MVRGPASLSALTPVAFPGSVKSAVAKLIGHFDGSGLKKERMQGRQISVLVLPKQVEPSKIAFDGLSFHDHESPPAYRFERLLRVGFVK